MCLCKPSIPYQVLYVPCIRLVSIVYYHTYLPVRSFGLCSSCFQMMSWGGHSQFKRWSFFYEFKFIIFKNDKYDSIDATYYVKSAALSALKICLTIIHAFNTYRPKIHTDPLTSSIPFCIYNFCMKIIFNFQWTSFLYLKTKLVLCCAL